MVKGYQLPGMGGGEGGGGRGEGGRDMYPGNFLK